MNIFPQLFLAIFSFAFSFSQSIVINEIDPNTPGSDTAEFIELYSSSPNVSLDGYVLVLFNGGDDASYAAYDLDGYNTDSNGYFIIGDSGVTGISITLSNTPDSFIQNGADAVALYQADKSDFPLDTSVTTANLVDAVVYDNNHDDDSGLLTGLGRTVQYNEDEANDNENQSLQRQSDGSFKVGTPSPNTSNLVLLLSIIPSKVINVYPNPTSKMLYFEGLEQSILVNIYSPTGQRVMSKEVLKSLDVSELVSGVFMLEITHNQTVTRQKLIKH